MESIDPDKISPMRVQGAGVSPTRTDISIRGIRVVIDEPPERGGGDLGATPPETLLAALVGCTNRICHKIAAARDIEIQDMSIDLDAAFDRRGVNLETEIDVPFREIRMTIELTTDADDVEVRALKADLTRFCPISKMLRQAGTRVEEVWTINAP